MRKDIFLPALAVAGGAAGFFLRRWELGPPPPPGAGPFGPGAPPPPAPLGPPRPLGPRGGRLGVLPPKGGKKKPVLRLPPPRPRRQVRRYSL